MGVQVSHGDYTMILKKLQIISKKYAEQWLFLQKQLQQLKLI